MSRNELGTWKPGPRDLIFLAVVGAVLLVLILGSGERKTRATPNDATHINVKTRAECMNCHSAGGVRPQPADHLKDGQCFQCHLQPKDWHGPTK